MTDSEEGFKRIRKKQNFDKKDKDIYIQETKS